jgi:ubiquinone/menaquinone biosynthesis C-methylase UbiE
MNGIKQIHRADSLIYPYIYNFIGELSLLPFGSGSRFRQLVYSSSEKINNTALRILDMGCGNGTLLSHIINNAQHIDKIAGIDISLAMITLARKRIYRQKAFNGSCLLVNSLAQSLPFKENYFDIVFNTLILHHQHKDEKIRLLQESHRVLKPGGEIITVDVDCPVTKIGWLIAFTRWHIPQVRANFRRPLIELHREAGYQNLKVTRRKWGIVSFIHGNKPQGVS